MAAVNEKGEARNELLSKRDGDAQRLNVVLIERVLIFMFCVFYFERGRQLGLIIDAQTENVPLRIYAHW